MRDCNDELTWIFTLTSLETICVVRALHCLYVNTWLDLNIIPVMLRKNSVPFDLYPRSTIVDPSNFRYQYMRTWWGRTLQ